MLSKNEKILYPNHFKSMATLMQKMMLSEPFDEMRVQNCWANPRADHWLLMSMDMYMVVKIHIYNWTHRKTSLYRTKRCCMMALYFHCAGRPPYVHQQLSTQSPICATHSLCFLKRSKPLCLACVRPLISFLRLVSATGKMWGKIIDCTSMVGGPDQGHGCIRKLIQSYSETNRVVFGN